MSNKKAPSPVKAKALEVESAKPKLIANKPKDEVATKAASELFTDDKKTSISKGGGG